MTEFVESYRVSLFDGQTHAGAGARTQHREPEEAESIPPPNRCTHLGDVSNPTTRCIFNRGHVGAHDYQKPSVSPVPQPDPDEHRTGHGFWPGPTVPPSWPTEPYVHLGGS